MDLFERGRSLGELGRTLRWSDLLAVIRHLPDNAHFRQALAKEVSQPDGEGEKRKPMTASEARAAVKARMHREAE